MRRQHIIVISIGAIIEEAHAAGQPGELELEPLEAQWSELWLEAAKELGSARRWEQERGTCTTGIRGMSGNDNAS